MPWGERVRSFFQPGQLAGLWLKAHRIEQSQYFKALITLPWVASGLRSGQCRGRSGKVGTCGSMAGIV
jgi:hypothetical protein